MARKIEIYSRGDNGEAVGVVDVAYVCSNGCYHSYCEDIGLPDEGLGEAHLVLTEFGITKCAYCSSVIVG